MNLEQEFENNFNCYTQIEHSDGGDTEEMAMTKGRFIEVVANILQANEPESSTKSDEVCDKNLCKDYNTIYKRCKFQNGECSMKQTSNYR